MEIQLRELIDQIKKDGVEAAENEAAAILEDARSQADRIIADARAQADKIVADAEAEKEKTVRTGEDAVRQAGRNLLISFRESVNRELNAIVGQAVSSVYSSEQLAQLVVKVVESWTQKPDADDLAVVMNTKDLEKLEENLMAALNDRLKSGVTLRANDNFDGGFRIAVDNGSVYYDYSCEAVVDMLSNYLSPRVTALLKEAE
ncbi:MAG: V-type ATP synthase subunit E [Clostridia bacterium]|nr:V-type ATP synthase subunit E [Clostridia bacterium]